MISDEHTHLVRVESASAVSFCSSAQLEYSPATVCVFTDVTTLNIKRGFLLMPARVAAAHVA